MSAITCFLILDRESHSSRSTEPGSLQVQWYKVSETYSGPEHMPIVHTFVLHLQQTCQRHPPKKPQSCLSQTMKPALNCWYGHEWWTEWHKCQYDHRDFPAKQQWACTGQSTYLIGDFVRDPNNILGCSNVIYMYSVGWEFMMVYQFLYVVLHLFFTKIVRMHLDILVQQLARLIQTIPWALSTIL